MGRKPRIPELHNPGKDALESRLMELMEDGDIQDISQEDVEDIAKKDAEFPALKAFAICVFLFLLFQLRWIPVLRDFWDAHFAGYGEALGKIWETAMKGLPF